MNPETAAAESAASSNDSFLNIDLESLGQKLVELTSEWGLKVLAAIAIFVIGRIIANILTRTLRSVMEKRKVEASLVTFVSGLAHALMIAFVVIAALSQVGIQTTSLVAIVGAAGLAIGLALQGSLANFAAGVLIIIFKPYRVKDYVVAGGAEGVVEDIGIFTTTLVTLDNRIQVVPNAIATGGIIENYTKKGIRRLDLIAGVSYKEDILKVKKVLEDIIAKESRVLAEPAPFVGVHEMAESSVNFAFRPWVKVQDYWDLYFHFNEQIKLRFVEEDISIPFPQRDVHLYKADA